MTVTETKQALGSWELRLKDSCPREILDSIGYLGHVVVVPGTLNVAQYGDALLAAARYVGVYLGRSELSDRILRGAGMAWWLGDSDGKGDIFETAVELEAETFANSITALLPPNGSIVAGTLHSVAGTYTGTHRYQTPRRAIDYVTGTFEAEWRVNGDGTLDAGEAADLYDGPNAMLHKKEPGRDLQLAAMSGLMQLETDVEDYTTRVVLLAEGEGEAIATGEADGPATPFNDIHGNPVVITRLVSESETSASNADQRAQLALSQFQNPRASVQLSTNEYDLKGDVQVGDWIWIHDPAAGFSDDANEVIWEGEAIHPLLSRVTELQWPIRPGWTVAFRTVDGEWLDLTEHYHGETGNTVIGVGDPPTSIVGISSEPVGTRPASDTSIPAAPAFTGFSPGSYQSGETSTTKAAIRVAWSTPLNTDGSVILDGDHYEIRYRVSAVLGYKVRWGVVGVPGSGALRWGQLSGSLWGAILSEPVEADPEWLTAYVAWGTNEFTILELTPGVSYEFQIRAVDAQTPPHVGPWSASEFVTTTGDLFAPQVPAAPTVAASRIAIQVTHTLGRASGGTFNLEQDLDHLEVHVGGSVDFYADANTLVGKLPANAGMLLGEIPVVGTFPVEQTDQIHIKVRAVDRAGNKSGASASATVTADLIDNAHISDLSVSKVTAGTITASWLIAGSIATADGGIRVQMNADGIQAFNGLGVQTVDISAATGNAAFVGDFTAGDPDGNRVEIKDGGAVFDNGPAISMFATAPNNGVEYKAVLEHVAQEPYGTFTRLARWPVDPLLQDDYSAGILMQEDATLLFNTTNGGESQLGLGYVNAGRVYIRGYWKDNNYVTNEDAVWTAAIHTGAGFSSWGHTYGPTMDSTMSPNVTLQSSAIVSWMLTASSTTGFTVTWSGTTDKWIYVWSARMG